MSIYVKEPMSLKAMETILNHLPDPTYVKIVLYGKINYDSVTSQASRLVGGIDLRVENHSSLAINKPTKGNIRDIYRKECEIEERKRKPDKDFHKLMIMPRIGFSEAEWNDDFSKTILTRFGISIVTSRDLPGYTEAIMREAAKNHFSFELKIDRW